MSESKELSKNKLGTNSILATATALTLGLIGGAAIDSSRNSAHASENPQVQQTEIAPEPELDTTMLREALGDNPIVIKKNYEEAVDALAEFIKVNNSEGGHLYVTIKEPTENTGNESSSALGRSSTKPFDVITVYFKDSRLSYSFAFDKGLTNQGKTPEAFVSAAVRKVPVEGLPAQVWFNDPNQEFQKTLKNAVKFSQQSEQSKPVDQQNLSPEKAMENEIKSALGKIEPTRFVYFVDTLGVISIIPKIGVEERNTDLGKQINEVSRNLNKILNKFFVLELGSDKVTGVLDAAGIENTTPSLERGIPLYE